MFVDINILFLYNNDVGLNIINFMKKIEPHLDSKLSAYRESANLYRQYETQGRVSVSLVSAFSILAISIVSKAEDQTLSIFVSIFMIIMSFLIMNMQFRLNELQKIYFESCKEIEKDIGVSVYNLWIKPSKTIIKATNNSILLSIIFCVMATWIIFLFVII